MSTAETETAVREPQRREDGPHPVREELRRIARDTSYAWRLATGKDELPPATPSDGPDPYGNPDPEWLRIDWREHRREIEGVGGQANYVEVGAGAAPALLHRRPGAWQDLLDNHPPFAHHPRVIPL